ncbi:DUF4383 domain-containing protein [Rhodococcus olei]|uniref:DUF4383 domain-containing protein n=1 Tax=Rhodococcus olei TaxID=2161675 RepID=A0ABP8PIP4_9NOCA
MEAQSERTPVGGSPVQVTALVLGLVFLVVGVLGFIPGVTRNYNLLAFAGHESGPALFGTFTVSVLHNIVHLIFGIAGVAMSRTHAAATTYLVGGGGIYLALWIYGLIVDEHSTANFVPVNTAGNWLHFGLGAGMVALGLVLGRIGVAHGAFRPRHT